MIIVKIIGGIGNQLFQYAFGKAIENKTGIKVYYDIEDFSTKYKLRKISLQHFNVKLNDAQSKEINELRSIYNKILYKIHRISHGLFIRKRDLKYYAERDYSFDKTVFSLNKDLYFNGYWQSEKYFYDIKDIIKSEFKIITPPNDTNLKALNQIHTSNSISIHIRRGDYITNPSASKVYHTCSIKYYENAIKYIAEKINNPLFFVFSDDIKWAESNLYSNHKLIFMDQNDADSNYEDLRLMSNCKHNIIANSTFSWWGAWLNNNEDKIVIAPKLWFSNNDHSSYDLIPSNWIKL